MSGVGRQVTFAKTDMGPRRSAPGMVADLLRTRIVAGELLPGTRIQVERAAEGLGVSANVVREALQLLERERLVTQILNRGIFVTQLDADAIRDSYRARNVLECGVLRVTQWLSPESKQALHDAINLGEKALADEDWPAAGNATTAFHSAIALMAGSHRVSTVMAQLLAELRLVMTPLRDHPDLHRVFVSQHRAIMEMIESHQMSKAEGALVRYLNDGEETLLKLLNESG